LPIPETRYAPADDGTVVAYQVFGSGPAKVVASPGGLSGLDVWWDWSPMHRYFERYAEFATIAWYDKRGTGSSDRLPSPPSLEERVDDVDVVARALGWDRFNLMGSSEGGPMAMLYAATRPERVERLILQGTFARLLSAPDHPIGERREVVEPFLEAWVGGWGTPETITGPIFLPSQVGAPGFVEWINRVERNSATPGLQRKMFLHTMEIDVREVLPAIRCPVLVLHAVGDAAIPVAHGRDLAERLGATYVEYEGEHFPWYVGTDVELDAIAPFLTGAPPPSAFDRVLASVLFTDIVDSTRQAAMAGDRAWRAVLDRHDSELSRVIADHRGRLVNTTGDGIVATFDSPTQSVRAGRAMVDAAARLGLDIRAGVHTGEIERRGEDIAGIAVHIAARVGALAGAGEVLVSSSLPPLVVGSGLEFESRGEHELKGVPGTWQVLRAT
jgi:class 3 adenylate cyclase/pimeloyl-ACP methyl ester carboxylesterase